MLAVRPSERTWTALAGHIHVRASVDMNASSIRAPPLRLLRLLESPGILGAVRCAQPHVPVLMPPTR